MADLASKSALETAKARGRQAGLIVLDNNNKEEIQGNKVLYAGRLARVALPCTRRSFSF
jgi:hypothetical protein